MNTLWICSLIELMNSAIVVKCGLLSALSAMNTTFSSRAVHTQGA